MQSQAQNQQLVPQDIDELLHKYDIVRNTLFDKYRISVESVRKMTIDDIANAARMCMRDAAIFHDAHLYRMILGSVTAIIIEAVAVSPDHDYKTCMFVFRGLMIQISDLFELGNITRSIAAIRRSSKPDDRFIIAPLVTFILWHLEHRFRFYTIVRDLEQVGHQVDALVAPIIRYTIEHPLVIYEKIEDFDVDDLYDQSTSRTDWHERLLMEYDDLTLYPRVARAAQ